MELIILGTGNAMVTKCYNTCFALKNNEEYFLVDAGGGNGILIQLEKAGIPATGIHKMFVTHKHTDHLLGVIWVIRKIASLMDAEKYEGDFTIYTHKEVIEIINMICELTLGKKITKYLGKRIVFQQLEDGDHIQAAGMKIQCFDIHSTKAKQFGFKATLPDQQRLVCLGDEPYHRDNKQYVENCDWLLSEAFCLYSERAQFKPYEKHHSTALDAGRDAQQLNVKNLILYHTEDKNIGQRKELYTIEAAKEFSGRIVVPDDLERIDLSR